MLSRPNTHRDLDCPDRWFCGENGVCYFSCLLTHLHLGDPPDAMQVREHVARLSVAEHQAAW